MNHYPGDDTETIADDKLVHCIVSSGLKSAQKGGYKCKHSAPSTEGLNDKCYS
jgi:hypothetical protein